MRIKLLLWEAERSHSLAPGPLDMAELVVQLAMKPPSFCISQLMPTKHPRQSCSLSELDSFS